MLKCLVGLVAGITTITFASYSDASGVPKFIKQYGNGDILVEGFTFSAVTGANCVNGFVWIKGTHPYRKEILSQLLTAKSTASEILFHIDTGNCYSGPYTGIYPELTTSMGDFITSK